MNREIKYTKENLQIAVAASKNFKQVAMYFNKNGNSNMRGFLAKKVRAFGINTDHFLSTRTNCGNRLTFKSKKTPEQIFNSGTQKTPQLRRALVESGVPYRCSECNTGAEWNGSPLVLQVDHIDGNRMNSSRSNLRFLCPNCHSQTDNYCVGYEYRGKKRRSRNVNGVDFIRINGLIDR